jgi:chlorobactene glucosyltransferase
MKLELIFFGLAVVAEILLWLRPLWRGRKYYSSAVILAVSISTGLLIGTSTSVWTVLVLVFSGYRIINLLRLVEGRTVSAFLYKVSLRSSMNLLFLQLSTLLLDYISHIIKLQVSFWLVLVIGLQILASLIFIYSFKKNVKKTASLPIQSHATRDLPTLSVLIPARNETLDLQECLGALVATDYPKLEIIVLDDCSQNKRTPQVIKSFSHAGVKFLEGGLPPAGWLAKNYAYEQLASNANGEILLFCGVDVRFEVSSLRRLIEQMLASNKSMISLLPDNITPTLSNIFGLLIQPTRYAWELALPRQLLKRPPVLSSCWLIKEKALKKAGSFSAIRRSVSVEAYFAKSIVKHNGYKFLRSGNTLGVKTVKQFSEQIETAVRTRYPQTHRRPELVCLIGLLEIGIFLLPVILFIAAITNGDRAVLMASIVMLIITEYFYNLIIKMTYGRYLFRGIKLMLMAAIYDIGLLNYSMWQHEFREVIWKGRNICLPVMHVDN